MTMNILSFKSVGNLDFGAKRQEIRRKLGSEFVEFRKTPNSINTVDDYSQFGFHLYYNKDDELEFIEMFHPAIPTFEGLNLLQGTLDELKMTLHKFDSNPEIDEYGCIFHEIGLAAFSGRPDTKIEAISVFVKDYYNL